MKVTGSVLPFFHPFSEAPSFMHSWLSGLCRLASLWRAPFTVSCRARVLPTSTIFFFFFWSMEVFICPLSLKRISLDAEFQVGGFSLLTLKYFPPFSSHSCGSGPCGLAAVISLGKSQPSLLPVFPRPALTLPLPLSGSPLTPEIVPPSSDVPRVLHFSLYVSVWAVSVDTSRALSSVHSFVPSLSFSVSCCLRVLFYYCF